LVEIKSITYSDSIVTFGYENLELDKDGFAMVTPETKAHILSSQPGLWIDPDTDTVLAKMKPRDKQVNTDKLDKATKTPDPAIVRQNTATSPTTPTSPAATAKATESFVAPLSAGKETGK
jgi:hypothetical protein